jgi:hypothetical protein
VTIRRQLDIALPIALARATSAALTCMLATTQACHTMQPAPSQPAQRDAIVLFDGHSLAAFDTFIRGEGLNVDTTHIFRVENGVVHVSGQGFGYFITKQRFHDYRLHAEFKWGDSTFLEKKGKARDSGILYHVQGPDKVWPRSLELQIQEGATGDMWLTDSAAANTRDGARINSRPGNGTMIARFGKGAWKDVVGYRDPNGEIERPLGEWNEVELVVRGDTARHYVNGKLVNEVTHLFPSDGKILFQSEGAELFFRNIRLYPTE